MKFNLKTTLIVVAMVGMVFGAMAQTAPLSIKQQGFVINAFDPNKSDTTACWFKAAFIISDTEVLEKWIKGYIVKFPYKSVAISSLSAIRHPDNEYFLWPDKKRFQQPVIAVIEL